MVNKEDFERSVEAAANEIVICTRCGTEEHQQFMSVVRVGNRGWSLCILCNHLFEGRVTRMLKTFFAPATKRGEDWY